MSETRNLLLWRLDTKNDPAVWRAAGLAGRNYCITLHKLSAEAFIIVPKEPNNFIFIAALEDTNVPIDDMKAYLQSDHDSCCAIRDLSAYVAHKQTKQAAEESVNKPRIIMP